MSCKTCNTNCIEAGTRDDKMCSAWTKRDDADMGNYFAKLAKVQTNISGTETAKQTNADRIRSMTDDELAEFLDRWALGDIDYSKTFCDLCKGQYDCHDDCLMDWLKEEVKDE